MNTKKVSELVSLKGKVAVVTGAASGIGFATARLLAEMGALTALLDINEPEGKKAAKEIEDSKRNAKFYTCDVTSSTDCRKVTERIYTEFCRIDVLVNCAGVVVRKDVVELSEKEWDFVLGVDLKAVYVLSHCVIPYMKKNRGGTIINIGSGWGLKGGPKAAAYCAAKGGVVTLTRAMAIDHGKDNIRVNCICPGDVDTPLLRGEAVQLGEELEEFMKEAADRPINRVGAPEDVAHAVLYLASELSSWVTGAILVVDGGGLA
ncbi:MAG: short-chain dehydrogenase [Theionarchaea archaeon DG-70-1]|nr:MAG: short-chain dehydrogenase [Theionarchaea archaeon DG-70-1]